MHKKLEQFKKRNRKRNAHLYLDETVEGTDYIVCPVSEERLSMIKSSYIERVLEMSVEEYDKLYPGARTVSESRKRNIKTGLHKIDPVSGKTWYQISQEKARKQLSEVDENGISGYKRKGQKTRATHMSNIDEYGRNGYSQLATKAIIKGNLTKAEKGIILDPRLRDEYYRYKSVVLYLTNKERKNITEGYKTGLAGVPGAHHIDHNYSIMQGYKNFVSPFVIGHLKNLRMLPWKENITKHSKSDITLIELLDITGYTYDESKTDFDNFIELIQRDIENLEPVSGAKILEKYYESTLCRK